MGLGDSQVALDILLNAVDNTKAGVESAGGGLGRLGSLIGVVAKTATATAGAALAFGGVAVKVFNDAGEAAHEMSTKFGMSVEQASSWLAAGRSMRMSNDTIMTGFQMLTRTMNNLDVQFLTTGKLTKQQTEVFKELNVSLFDAHGKMRPINDVMLDISTRFAKMPDGVEKAALAMKLFGRSGTDMIPFLNQGGKNLQDMMLAAKQYGAVVGEDDVDATRGFHLQLAELKLRGEGVLITFARGLMPVLGTFFGLVNGRVMPVLLDFSQWFAREGAPRLQDFSLKLVQVGEKEFPKLMNGAKGAWSQLQPLIDPLKQIASQLIGLIPALGSTTNLMSIWSGASSQLPTLLSLVAVALKVAAPLIKMIGDNANVVAPALYAMGTAFMAWKVIGIAQLVFGLGAEFMAMAAKEGVAAAATTLLGISFGPLTLILFAVAAVVGLVALAWKNNWFDIQGKTKAAIDFIGGVIGVVGPWLRQYIIAPLGAAVGFIKGHWDAISAVIGLALGVIRTLIMVDVAIWTAVFRVAWEVIKANVAFAMAFVQVAISTFGPIVRTFLINPMAAAVGAISGHWEMIKGIIGSALGLIRALFTGDLGGVVKGAKDLFGRVADAIIGIFKNIHIPMPHFSFTGSMNPADWAKGQPPGLNVQWYGGGGDFVANQPMLIGVGERGAERVRITPAGSGGGPTIQVIVYGSLIQQGDLIASIQKAINQNRRLAGGAI